MVARAGFGEAIKFLRDKIQMPTRIWTDVFKSGHDTAFMVAGILQKDILADIQKALLVAEENGLTLDDFREQFDEVIIKYGYPLEKLKNLKYKKWRTKLIYETNINQSYAAGRYQQAVRLGRKYARYIAINDERTRPEHKAWHGTILPVDDKWWDTHTPGNGWNCRCSIQYLTQSQAQRFLPNQDLAKTKAPPIEYEAQQIKIGEGKYKMVTVPKGIDAGFDYNPGKRRAVITSKGITTKPLSRRLTTKK